MSALDFRQLLLSLRPLRLLGAMMPRLVQNGFDLRELVGAFGQSGFEFDTFRLGPSARDPEPLHVTFERKKALLQILNLLTLMIDHLVVPVDFSPGFSPPSVVFHQGLMRPVRRRGTWRETHV
jgi:hypothetical protein